MTVADDEDQNNHDWDDYYCDVDDVDDDCYTVCFDKEVIVVVVLDDDDDNHNNENDDDSVL